MTSPIGALMNHRAVALVCGIFFMLGLLRLNDLSSCTPDSCRYLIWGNSLAHGHGYLDPTQPDPDRFVVYPPLYPVLIAPVEAVFPMSLLAVKVWTLLWGVLALILFYFWILSAFGKRAAIWTTLMFALNPAMLLFSTEALSEAPFIAIVLLILILVEKSTMAEGAGGWSFWLFLLLLPAVTLVRETGIALVMAVVFVLISRRQVKRAFLAFAVAAVILSLWYIRNQVLVVPRVA